MFGLKKKKIKLDSYIDSNDKANKQKKLIVANRQANKDKLDNWLETNKYIIVLGIGKPDKLGYQLPAYNVCELIYCRGYHHEFNIPSDPTKLVKLIQKCTTRRCIGSFKTRNQAERHVSELYDNERELVVYIEEI